MNAEDQKKQAATAALKYVEEKSVVGVGTGSTVNYFIDALATMKYDIEGAVPSSKATAQRLKNCGITVIDPNTISDIPIYVDGADEVNDHLQMIKGGGGALTGEKIIAAMSRKFICITDARKLVANLGTFPVAVEVLPIARSFVGRELVKLGGDPAYREHFVSDYGNIILDVYNLPLTDPKAMEQMINQIPGVVCNGLFAVKPASVLLLASETGVQTINRA